jgi:hypothetical protein
MIGANATVSIYNLIIGTSLDEYPANPDFENIEAYIESQSAQITQVMGQQPNIETFELFIDPLEIQMGAKVIDQANKEYRVVGIERHENNQDTDDLYRITMNSKHI